MEKYNEPKSIPTLDHRSSDNTEIKTIANTSSGHQAKLGSTFFVVVLHKG